MTDKDEVHDEFHQMISELIDECPEARGILNSVHLYVGDEFYRIEWELFSCHEIPRGELSQDRVKFGIVEILKSVLKHILHSQKMVGALGGSNGQEDDKS